MPAGMTHNDCEMQKDIIKPIEQFFLESNVLPTVTEGTILKIMKHMTIPPEEIRMQATEKEREALNVLLNKNESKKSVVAT